MLFLSLVELLNHILLYYKIMLLSNRFYYGIIFIMKIFVLIILIFMTSCAKEGEPIVIPNVPTEAKSELQTVVKIASAYPQNSPAGVFLEAFALELSNLSNDRIQTVVYHDGSIGDELELGEMLLNGSVDFALMPLGEDDAFYEIANAPFLLNEDNIDEVVDLLRDGETELSDPRALTYINGGSIGLSTSSRAQSSRQLFDTDSPVEGLNPIEITSVPATRFEEEYEYRYYADIAVHYDILYFFQSTDSRIDFTEQQMVVNATEQAMQDTQEWYEQNVDIITEKVTTYIPDDHQNYIESLSQSDQIYDTSGLPNELIDALNL